MEENILTKNQQKKMRKQEHWLKKKQEKKALKKKKRKRPDKESLFKKSREEWEKRKSEGLKVIIDCDFESYQTEKEKISLKQQLMYCYAVNKRSEFPLNISVMGMPASLIEELQKVSWGNWDIEFSRENYLSKYSKEKLIYLTADSENEIDSFDYEAVYVIGGLVDHNRLKHITLNKANADEIKTAKLPLSKYVKLQRSSVLTVNHMIELMLQYVIKQDWKLAILEAIPQRKYSALLDN